MCTKEEVREVILEERLPVLAKIALSSFGVGFLMLVAWALFTIHSQEGNTKDLKVEVVKMIGSINTNLHQNNSLIMTKISSLNSSFLLNNAMLTGKIELLTTQLKNIKEVAIDRSSDRYTGKQARSRNALVDERCDSVNKRIDNNKNNIEKYHKIN